MDAGIGSFLGQIQGNIKNRFFFRVDDPSDAETIASFFGTALVKRTTTRMSEGAETSDGSVRDAHEFKIHPDIIKSLSVGRCIFSSKTSGRLMELQIPMPSLKKYQKRRPLLRGSAESLPEAAISAGEAIEREFTPKLKKPTRKETDVCAT